MHFSQSSVAVIVWWCGVLCFVNYVMIVDKDVVGWR